MSGLRLSLTGGLIKTIRLMIGIFTLNYRCVSGHQKKNSQQQKDQPGQASQLRADGPDLFGDDEGCETDDPSNIHYAANK